MDAKLSANRIRRQGNGGIGSDHTAVLVASLRSPAGWPQSMKRSYESRNFGANIDFSSLFGRWTAFFLAFFDFLIGFFATLDFLDFLAIGAPLVVPRHREPRCAQVKVPTLLNDSDPSGRWRAR
jgi:hypothetical protein